MPAKNDFSSSSSSPSCCFLHWMDRWTIRRTFCFFLLVDLLQVRTHAFRKVHENIDSILKAAESVLTQFEVSRQVCMFVWMDGWMDGALLNPSALLSV